MRPFEGLVKKERLGCGDTEWDSEPEDMVIWP